ncbi:MAG: DUF6063 family protein [Veillonellaceae bacterium]|nr:DUF6063 family protein [Veillonellaceae bacterium]
MTEYTEKTVLDAFDLYSKLAAASSVPKAENAQLYSDEDIRSLAQRFAAHVGCTIIDDADKIYLIPVKPDAMFHMTNDQIKKKYLHANALNMDIYLMYLAIIVFVGCFYDSYHTIEPHDFVTLSTWLDKMNQRMDALASRSEEELRQAETGYNFNWVPLLRKWADLDSVKETAKRQDGRTRSRIAILKQTKSFLEAQGLLHDNGADEYSLTEKAKTIFVNYYFEERYNRGITDFMYSLDHKAKEDDSHAIDQQDPLHERRL